MKTLHCFILIISSLTFACGNDPPVTDTRSEYRVRVARVTPGMISIPVHTAGILSFSEELKLSFKTGGIVASVNVKEGDHVKKGDLLASLDLSEIKANVGQAQNGYEKTLRDLERVENLYRDSVVTLEQKQNSTTALNIAKSTLEIAKFNLTHSSITAPANGIILKQLARQNEMVSPGYPVFLFGSSGKLWKIKSNLSDRDIVKVNPGDSAAVRFDAYPEVEFRAVVGQVGGITDPYTGTIEIELLLQDPGYRLVSGFVAEVDVFPAGKKEYLTIPLGSIVEADGMLGYVYAVTDSMTARKIRISIESISDSIAAVRGIPEEFDKVVKEGAAYLRDGVRVIIVSERN